jgi:localization factor PodJL
MANAMPWSVRGIDPDVREQAVEAAHRSGLSVGQWLNQVLADNLDEEGVEAPPRQPPRRARRVETLDQRLARIGRGRQDTAAERFTRDEDEENPRMMGLLEQAISAIERLETTTSRQQMPPAQSRSEAPQAPRGDELLQAIRSLETRIQVLAAQPAAQSTARPAPLARGQRAAVDDDPHFSAAIAEIEARRRELDAAAGPGRATARPAGVPPRRMEETRAPEQMRHIEEMRQQLDQLVGRIDDMRREQRPESARLQDRMDHLAQRIEEWRGRPNEDVALIRRDLASLGAAIDQFAPSRLQDRVEQLTQRIEDWRSRPNEDVALIRRDIASLSAAIEQLAPARLVGMVENAVAGIAERAFRTPRDPQSDQLLASVIELQDDVRAVMQEIASARGSERLSQDVLVVARRLEEIGKATPDLSRLDDVMRETDQIKALIGQAMRAQPLEGLTHQLDALGKEFERFARQPQPVRDDRPVIDAIREVRDRVERIDPAATFQGVEQRLQAIAAIETRLGALSGIEEKLETIARDVSKLAKDAKPLPQLDSIAQRLERIDKVLDGSKKEPLAGLNDLAAKVEKLGQSLEKASERQPDQLAGMLEQLSSRIDAAQANRTDHGALDQLQDEIARLGRKLEEMSPGTPGLEGVERNVSDLIAQFDLARQDFQKGAAEVAEKAARDAVKSFAREESTDTLAAEGLLLLKRDLGEFKSQQGESERRTRQMLEALHGTLDAVATRLGQIETVRMEAPRAPQMMPPATPAPTSASAMAQPQAPAIKADPAPQMRAPATPTREAAPAVQRPATSQPAPDDFADLPLEPGQKPGDPFTGAVGDQAMSADPRTNFIAAARRAAQAAAQQSQEALDAEKAARDQVGLVGKLKNLIPRGKAKDAAQPNPVATAAARTPLRDIGPRGGMNAAPAAQSASFITRQRRPIIIGLAALILALGALKMLRGGGDGPAAELIPPLPQVQERLEPPAKPDTPAKPEQQSRVETPVAPRAEAETTASLPPPVIATTPNGQQVIIPTLNQPMASAKRAQRLGETAAITQADPITVGSIAPDGSAKPVETGRAAIVELANLSKLHGQERLRDAALAGSPAAIFEIGARLADGRGMARDTKLAARWFEQAAAQGHGPSQYRLASLHREGRGVARDAALAFQWFDRAAAQGHVLAMHNAAVLLAEGVHGAPDYAGAALWFKRAAEHGVKDSQFNVAILFARGLGVNQDLVEAWRWFSAAAAQGDQDAVKKRDDIAARLTKEQLAKERDWLKNFVPTKSNPAANEAGNWETATRAAPAQTQRSSRPPQG